MAGQALTGQSDAAAKCAALAGQALTGQSDAAAKCAALAGQALTGQSDAAAKCAALTGQALTGQSDAAAKCAALTGQALTGQSDAAAKCAALTGQALTGQSDAAAKCAALTGQALTGQSDAAAKCAALTGQALTGQSDAAAKCAALADQEITGQADVSFKCAGEADLNTDSRRSVTSPLCAVSAACATELPSKRSQAGKTSCSCGSCAPCRKEEALSRAREICTMPHDADPAETFLMDILADDSSSLKGAGMSIRFFLPEELYELWNMMAMNWLMKVTAEEAMGEAVENAKDITVEEVNESPMRYLGYAEGFLAALLQDYILTERIHLKVSRNYAILKRDHFQCQVPGCKCRRNLQVHHIIWRSKGGGDEHFNLITLCKVCHKHILHDLMALKIEGTAPHNLTFTFEPTSSHGEGPFLVYHNGRKTTAPEPERWSKASGSGEMEHSSLRSQLE